MRKFQKISGRTILYIVLIITSLIMFVPFYWAITSSIKMEQFIFASPPQWWPSPITFKNYLGMLQRVPGFPRYFLNSVLIAGAITLAHVFFDTLAAYAFAKLKFPGRDAIFFMMLLGLMVPFQVNMIPIYRILSSLKMVDTYAALIVPNMTSIFGIFLMRQFLISIPNDLLDAARIDGCDELGVFARVIFPLTLPGLATLIVFIFMNAWNDFLWPRIVLNSDKMLTLPVGLAQLQLKNTSNEAQIMAGTVLTMLPMILVYLFMQKQFIEGMTSGAVKG
jgi:ABC-type glycerol-3-phosphate transport system permease component